MKQLITILFLLCLQAYNLQAQVFAVSGKVTDQEGGKAIADATVCLQPSNTCVTTDAKGNYKIEHVKAGTYTLAVVYFGAEQSKQEITVADKNITMNVSLKARVHVLDSVSVKTYKQSFGATHLKDVDGIGIYAGKKSEVIVLKDITVNTATNNARQIYFNVAGLNIWENDGAGIQLAIGGRGLDPNRVSNFNTRQNGYDISADALGYPESYYTPPADAMERIEIVRGAASLQYGTQFGGIINFKMNKGVDTAKYQVVARETVGSWGFLNSSNSIGGTIKKWNYYAFYEHKQGNGWRPDAQFNVNTVYLATTYKATSKLSLTAEFTHMDYLEHQPGGLNDVMFNTDPRQSTKERNWFKVHWNLAAAIIDYAIAPNLTFNSRFFGLWADRDALGVITTVVDPGGARQYRTDAYSNWGNESRLLYNYNLKNANPFSLLGGFRYYHGYTNRQIGDANDGANGTKADFSFSKSSLVDSLNYSHYTFPNHNISLFAENIFRVNSKLSIIPGLRYEQIVTEANGFYNSFVQDRAGNVIYNQVIEENRVSNRSFVIGGIGLSYDKSKSCQLYANISQNYKSINFNDMSIVNPNYRVNPDLKDEKGYSADLGARGSYTNLVNYDVSLFTIDYADKIGTILASDKTSPNTYQYVTNISQSRNLGVESFAEVDLWKFIRGRNAKTKLFLFSNFSWISAQYIDSKEAAYNKKQVEFVPAVILKTGLTLRMKRFWATYQYAYVARQFTDATNSTIPTNNGINGLVPAYNVMDISANYWFTKVFSISASINNLANNMYYTRRADSYPGPGIIPADGRGFYLTLQVKI